MQGESVDNRHAELAQRNRSNAQTKSSAATWVKEASKSETHVGSCSVSNEECSGTTRCPVTRPLMEETMRSTLSSLKQYAEDGDSYCHARLVCVPEARDELNSVD